MTHDIFLSHNSANKVLVRQLFKDIEEVDFQGRQLTAWFDEIDIDHGKSITGLINQGLEQSKFFAIIMSPEYFSSVSGWTDAEWHAVLFDDPDNRSGRIIPILADDCPNLPPLLKHLKYIDIRGSQYSKGLTQLLDRITGRNPSRKVKNNVFNHLSGAFIEQSQPEQINERLTSNLLPILEIPKEIYFGKIKQSFLKPGKVMLTKSELKDLLHQVQTEKDSTNKPYMPAFRVYKDQIVTFYNLFDKTVLLSSIIEHGTVTTEKTTDLLSNEDLSNLITSLLNMSISRHILKCGLMQDNERQARFYFPTDKGNARTIEWKSFKNQASRTVAKPVKVYEDHTLWLHQGASIRLMTLAGKFYLQIIPTWVLTNGITPVGGRDVAKIVNKWTNAERNLSVVRHIKFWSSILSKGDSKISIFCGSSFITIDSMTAEINMQVGIKDDQILLLDETIEMISIDDIIEGKLSKSIGIDISELEDFTEDEEDDEIYAEEEIE